MSTASPSLVKYDNPILVSTKESAKGRKGIDAKAKVTPTEDILNSILPPLEWTENGQLWVQYVSSTPATRGDVVSLQEQLDLRLQQRLARETGICPIREELYAQCFDEIIRQVTINCAERGLLLLRVRDELRMTVSTYQTLYDSSIAFGMRKALQAEQNRADMLAQIKQLEAECKDIHKQATDLQEQIDNLEQQERQRREDAAQKHQEDVEFLQKHNLELKSELENMLSLPSEHEPAAVHH